MTTGGAVSKICLLLLVAITGMLPVMSHAQSPDTTGNTSLLEAERSFCRIAAEQGIREGFLSVLDPEAVVFRPGPVPARKWYTDHDSIPGLLAWQPAFVMASGDLGFTTGPWQYRTKSAADDPDAYGDYVSVWTRSEPRPKDPQAPVVVGSGPWRLLFDIGVGHGKPPDAPAASPELGLADRAIRGGSADAGTPGNLAEIGLARADLLALDRQFARDLADGVAAGFYTSHTDSTTRLLREGRLPVLGTKGVLATLADSARVIAWSPQEAAVSPWLDFAYTRGEVRVARPGAPPEGILAHYLRTWRRIEGKDDWQIVLECIPESP
jgi:hypothetical protein